MAKQSVHTMHFNCDPDTLMKVITQPAFLEANFKMQDNPDARVKVESETEDRKVVVAEVTEYAKGLTGVDRSKTEQTVTTYEWDVKNRKATWSYKSPHSQVRVSGAIQITPSGDGSDLREEFNVTVKVPLAGGKIEKMVIKEVDSYWPKYENLVREWCQKAG